MGAGAVGHEEGFGGVLLHLRADDLAVGQIDGAGDVAAGEHGGAADVEEDEVGSLRQGVVDVPAIGFESELGGKMFAGEDAGGGGVAATEVGMWFSFAS